MRWSRYYVPTLKESPAEADVVSHRLLTRAGMIRRLTSGIYSYLPLGLRALDKVADVLRLEMNAAGAIEVLLPMVQPGDLWKETDRWELYGKELLRLSDRHGRDYCLGPTHEEVITDLVRGEVRSYRQLPLNLYQIQTKFRDEIRPRFGLMRGREFVMKDAYSFDRDEAGAEASYRRMYDAYGRAFARMGLEFRAVEADSGAIGGAYSHEFMVMADTGEDVMAACSACEYGANLEKAKAVCDVPATDEKVPRASRTATPGAHTVEDVAGQLGVKPSEVVKTLLFDADGEIVAALVRGDRELNDVKLANHLGAGRLSLATAGQVEKVSGAPVGFAGPVGLSGVRILADLELCAGNGWVVGANEADAHLVNVDLGRDVGEVEYADLRNVVMGDVCPECRTALTLTRGIEVGHVFKLGLKYSRAMNAVYLDETGREKHMVMGCYGIGVSRIVAAAIEQNHDENGIKWPPTIAPFEVCVVGLGKEGEEAWTRAEEIYLHLLGAGVDAILDDRPERPGVKFKDADLVGFPIQVVVGGKGLGRGVIEVKDRRTGEKAELPDRDFASTFADWRARVWSGWNLDTA
jgi:prolyl-tRNA synthetase